MAGAKHFTLDKILTVSAGEYCKSKGKKLSDYEMIGVHSEGHTPQMVAEHLGNQTNNDAEVIVNYQFMQYSVPNKNYPSTEQQMIIASGTALVPKIKK